MLGWGWALHWDGAADRVEVGTINGAGKEARHRTGQQKRGMWDLMKL